MVCLWSIPCGTSAWYLREALGIPHQPIKYARFLHSRKPPTPPFWNILCVKPNRHCTEKYLCFQPSGPIVVWPTRFWSQALKGATKPPPAPSRASQARRRCSSGSAGFWEPSEGSNATGSIVTLRRGLAERLRLPSDKLDFLGGAGAGGRTA